MTYRHVNHLSTGYLSSAFPDLQLSRFPVETLLLHNVSFTLNLYGYCPTFLYVFSRDGKHFKCLQSRTKKDIL
jgi:hypothetical protein